MSYLEEWNRIEQMIESNNISKSTTVTSEKVRDLASMHIAKCLSALTDSLMFDPSKCVESVTCNKNTEEITDAKPCNNCIHSNDEYELNCSVCDEKHSEYKPFGFRSEKEEIEVRCPSCGEIITAIKFKEDILNLKCPTCGIDFNYNINTNVREWRI